MLNEAAIESAIQAKGLNAPRLTPAAIDAVIVAEDYHVFPGTTLTVCCLTLRNGYTVTGESAAASPANFDAEISRKIARDNARNKIWALEGYAQHKQKNTRPASPSRQKITASASHSSASSKQTKPHTHTKTPKTKPTTTAPS